MGLHRRGPALGREVHVLMSCSAAEDCDESMSKASAADAPQGMPVDQLHEAGGWRVALLVKEPRLDGGAKDETAHGDNAYHRAAAKEADRGRLGCVAQRPQGDKRPDEEVTMGHADLQAALPRLQAFTVEGHGVHILLGKEAARHGRLHLVTRERLRAPPLDGGASIPESCRAGHQQGDLALRAHLAPLGLPPRVVLARPELLRLRHVDAHVPEVEPSHLRGLARPVGLGVHLQGVEIGVFGWIIPLLLWHGRQELVQRLLLHDCSWDALEVRHGLGLGLLRDLNVPTLRLPCGAGSAAPCTRHTAHQRCQSTVAHAEGKQPLCTKRRSRRSDGLESDATMGFLHSLRMVEAGAARLWNPRSHESR
mmetsp:Transcript_111397/g.270646  ORF Transcript_111397/g.270646 Transcript_111397/m.270646 type:complete len:366 (-) Transcript_111397:135-1232(-)